MPSLHCAAPSVDVTTSSNAPSVSSEDAPNAIVSRRSVVRRPRERPPRAVARLEQIGVPIPKAHFERVIKFGTLRGVCSLRAFFPIVDEAPPNPLLPILRYGARFTANKPPHNFLKKLLTSRSFLRAALRRRLLSCVQRPCLKLPLRSPDGPPEPFAPPCIRQRARPLTAACRQGRPVRVLAPQRGALAIFANRRAMSA